MADFEFYAKVPYSRQSYKSLAKHEQNYKLRLN